MSEDPERKTDKDESIDKLDEVLTEVGEFGKNQIGHFVLISLLIILASVYAVEFIVTSSTVDYRCLIPECDSSNDIGNYNQPWLGNAIPFRNGRPSKCQRYNKISNSTQIDPLKCPKSVFNVSDIVQCNEFVFKTNEHRITKEFNILCEENEYKLALVGTINNFGGFLFMPLTGILSDKFGRLTILVWGIFGNGIFGILKAFATSYAWFMTCEFLGASIGTCTYMAAFLLCVEWVSNKKRVLSSTIVSVIYPLGEVLLGLAAIYYENYKSFLIAIYVPALLSITYFWLVPESVRWLVVTGQYTRAEKILKANAKHNNTQLSKNSLEILRNECHANDAKTSQVAAESVLTLFKHKILVLRLILCSMCWIMVVHIFYGLSLNATKIADDDNKYLSYIVVMIAEMPAAIISYFLLEYIGRRKAMCGTLTTAGLATIISTVIPTHHTIIIRICLFIGMCATSSAFAVLYVFSAEIWPTGMRNTLMNTCSMIGRFGSMLAPLTTLFGHYMPALPFLIFGGTAMLSGLISFLLPETRNKKLPNLLEEARRL